MTGDIAGLILLLLPNIVFFALGLLVGFVEGEQRARERHRDGQ